jgi:hypothetical protein
MILAHDFSSVDFEVGWLINVTGPPKKINQIKEARKISLCDKIITL